VTLEEFQGTSNNRLTCGSKDAVNVLSWSSGLNVISASDALDTNLGCVQIYCDQHWAGDFKHSALSSSALWLCCIFHTQQSTSCFHLENTKHLRYAELNRNEIRVAHRRRVRSKPQVFIDRRQWRFWNENTGGATARPRKKVGGCNANVCPAW